MDTNIAEELLILAGRDNIGDFNRVNKIIGALNKQTKLSRNDFFALDEGKKYVRRMQELLERQDQRQSQ